MDPELADAPSIPLASDAPATLSFDDAVRSLTEDRQKLVSGEKPPAESAESATAEPELPVEGNADLEAIPPIERPRSWAKELDEEWASYPREAQERIAKREQERDSAIRRSQNEAADIRKAAEAARAEAEKAKQQYEAQLPQLLQTLESAHQASFADIKTMQDVAKLQAEDPFRFQAWQVHQMQLQATKQETDRIAQERQATEQSEWATYVQKENTRAAELIPELADKDKSEKLMTRVAKELLPELGFTDSELTALANGKQKLAIYDHRVQRLLADSVKLRDIENAPKAAAKPNLPPVQRPGTAKPATSSVAAQIQTLERQLNTATGDKAARLSAQILQLERKAASR